MQLYLKDVKANMARDPEFIGACQHKPSCNLNNWDKIALDAARAVWLCGSSHKCFGSAKAYGDHMPPLAIPNMSALSS